MEESNNILEEEIKNRLRDDFFKDYDASPIIGKIDFAVTLKCKGEEIFDKEYFLWAEAKRSPKEDLIDSFVQLVITIGKAKTHEKLLPPYYLGAFDKEKIAFIEFHNVIGALYQGEINWNVAPSDHKSDTFLQLRSTLKDILQQGMSVFNLKKDEKTLRKFINKNFRLGKDRTSRINITRNNFMFVFQRWVEEVKPSIAVEWDDVPKTSVVDFFYADLISRDDYTRSEDLAVVLRGDRYKILQQILKSGTQLFSEAFFNDKKAAYKQFWNKYERPPRKEYLGVILERRDLLIPHDLRKYHGAYFTPPQWVQKSQEYLAEELGEDWQKEYYVWDCCAGTGNLLYGLTEEYNVWASDVSSGFVQVMKERIKEKSLTLLEKHVFTFDFLNDPFSKLPPRLQNIINDPEERKRLIVYINPPFAEAGDASQLTGTGKNKTDVAVTTAIYKKYQRKIGIAGRELFAQIFYRVYDEIPGAILAHFSTLKPLQAPNFKQYRDTFQAKLTRSFIVPAYTFDNVKSKFPIGFFIWRTDIKQPFIEIEADMFDSKGINFGKKTIINYDHVKGNIGKWVNEMRDDKNSFKLGFMSNGRNDFQNQKLVYFINEKSQLPTPRGWWITPKNLHRMVVFVAVRHSIEATWLNDRDQFLYPKSGWEKDSDFLMDCLVYTIFCFYNNIRSDISTNHWIPFTEEEVNANDTMSSHFMSDILKGKRPFMPIDCVYNKTGEGLLFENSENKIPTTQIQPQAPLLSKEAQAVKDAGLVLWQYYHQNANANPDASLYDIRGYFQGFTKDDKGKEKMNTESRDTKYNHMISDLRQKLKLLSKRIEPKVYKYGFLISDKDAQYV